MTAYLLAISVGPVQEFIAAARRTRDLWFGSHMLSEISRAAAIEVAKHGKLIFPARTGSASVANVILAELNMDNPKEVAKQAKKVALERWGKFAEEARQEASEVIRADLWKDQVQDVIEFYAAWVPHTDPQKYKEDRARVMRLLAGRKNCRDFEQARLLDAGLRKSSLDGQRESVLKPPSQWPARFRARLRVREGEQLDVVGLVKRVAGGNQPYPSVARVAADPWVRGNQERLGDVVSACRQLGNQVIRPLSTNAHPQFATFAFEGTAVFTSRHHELEQETEVTPEQLRPLGDSLARLPEPEPYLAILVADGDKMGDAISRFESADAHRAFSQALAGFATAATIIVNEHHGVLVYAGGDDVLAFLPVDKCLDCARKLHDKFGELLTKYGTLTLSVGLAIGHFMENLEDLLEYGRAAEKRAKQPDRDGLAVHLHKRGGAPIRVRAKWTEDPSPDVRISRYARLILAEAIPSKLPYDLRKLADLYASWPTHTVATALRQDLLRVIRDKQPRSGLQHMTQIEALLNQPASDAAKLRVFAEDLLVARQIATALRQVRERPAPVTEVAS
jgi:CRISPR-associated protein Cmr2